MLKLLLLTIPVTVVALVLAPHIVAALSWVLAFLALLMAGDLLRSELRRLRRTSRHG
jgi:hypothetical protein